MRGHEQIITALNDVLTAELTAVNQYFVHARMCENWAISGSGRRSRPSPSGR
jgi:bacterioferritin